MSQNFNYEEAVSGCKTMEDITGPDGFEPDIIKKRSVVEGGLESQVVSMYAKDMTTRDIADHVQSLYGIKISPSSISNITDKVMDEAKFC